MRVTVRVKPGASRTGVGGDHDGALVVRVTARAADGKATEAALRALAAALGVRRGDVSLATGASSRTKVVDVVTSVDTEAVLTERVLLLRTAPEG
jgi:uncharacterized protein YggU (UPF0235/DUF167 family)